MPVPKLLTFKGTKMPEWNLTAAQLDKEQAAFRQEAAAEAMSLKDAAKGAKKAGEKATAKKAAKKKPASAAAAKAMVSPLVLTSHKELVIDKVKIADLVKLILARKRKDQKTFTATEWNTYIDAIEAIAAPGAASPTYKDFVNVHVKAMTGAGHAWGVHTMMGMKGRNFLAWHREYLARLEARLMLVNPLVTIPYWNWVVNRSVPSQLSNASDLASWGIARGTFDAGGLPTQADINSVMLKNTFDTFQSALEGGPHNWVHNAVGGTMATSGSPADPLFWLHHANVDRIWADWQKTHTSASQKPSNLTEQMQPPPIITRKVSDVLSTNALGYVYA
jgi:tyrosinase